MSTTKESGIEVPSQGNEYLRAISEVTRSANRMTEAVKHLSQLKDQEWTMEEVESIKRDKRVAECDRALKKMNNTLRVL